MHNYNYCKYFKNYRKTDCVLMMNYCTVVTYMSSSDL